MALVAAYTGLRQGELFALTIGQVDPAARVIDVDRKVIEVVGHLAGWRDEAGNGPWTWHSRRHVLCTTALSTWKLDTADVSAIAGHANVRTTLDMNVGTAAGLLDRARTATA